jgi:hypothetical protein
MIFETERRFCVDPKTLPFSQYQGWCSDHYYNQNLVTILLGLTDVIVRTADACNRIAAMFSMIIQLPPPIAPGYTVFCSRTTQRHPCRSSVNSVWRLALVGREGEFSGQLSMNEARAVRHCQRLWILTHRKREYVRPVVVPGDVQIEFSSLNLVEVLLFAQLLHDRNVRHGEVWLVYRRDRSHLGGGYLHGVDSISKVPGVRCRPETVRR